MYKDRGIIKWLPFDALSGFRESINKLTKYRSKVNMPVISDDQILDLNYKLEEALAYNKEISLIYYEQGFYKEISGLVTKLCLYERMISFNNLKIKLDLVLEINFI